MKLVVIIIALITISCSTSKKAVVAIESNGKSNTIFQKEKAPTHESEHITELK